MRLSFRLLFVSLLLAALFGLGAACDTLPLQESPLSEPHPLDASETLPETSPEVSPEDLPETKREPEISVEASEPLRETSLEKKETLPETDIESQKESVVSETPEKPTGPQKIKWGSLQWPPTATTYTSQASRPIYGQFYAPGYTDQQKGQALSKIQVELGYGPFDVDPQKNPQQWQWSSQATFYKSAGIGENNHEYRGTLSIAKAGIYRYTYRYKLEDGPWFYADRADYGRSGSDDGVTLEEMGVIAVVAPQAKLRMASFNLHCLVDQPERRLQAIADAIAQAQLDFISLQEVCRPQSGSTPDSATRLATLLQQKGLAYQSFFAQTHVAQHSNTNFDEGIGFLSRHPVLETQALSLPPNETPPTGAFPRKAAWSRIATPVGILSLLSTHLSFRSDHAWWRAKQAAALKVAMMDRAYLANAWIVGGDFNANPTEDAYKTMTQTDTPAQTPAWIDLLKGRDEGPTFPATHPSIRIDYLFLSQPTDPLDAPVKLRPLQGKRFLTLPQQGLYLSDHVGILVELEASPSP